jgi:hypothetical protein
MRRSSVSFALALAPMPAFGEVCDKVNESWQSGAPPVGFWPEVVSSVSSPLGLIVLLCCLVVAWTKLAWLQIAAAATLAGGAAFFLMFEDPILAAAREEGCVGPAGAILVPLMGLAAAMLARAMVPRIPRGEST